MSKNSQDHFVGGLGLGLAVGTGMALLLTTKRGMQVRQKLAGLVTEIKAELEQGDLSEQRGIPQPDGLPQASSVGLQPLNSSLQPTTIRDLLESFYAVVKSELADLANVPPHEIKVSSKKRQKKSGKFKNTKKR